MVLYFQIFIPVLCVLLNCGIEKENNLNKLIKTFSCLALKNYKNRFAISISDLDLACSPLNRDLF